MKVRRALKHAALAMIVGAIPAIAGAQTAFTIGTVTAPPGTIASGELTVPESGGQPGTVIPISIVNGARPGPVLVLTAGVHGSEYPPILALQRLRASLDPKSIAGTVVMVHVANMPSYLKRTVYYSPVDGKNLNRVFPGRADGTISERIAYVLTKDVLERASAVVDLHCGDANESLRPYSYWETVGAPGVQEEGRKLALAFGLDHIVIDASRPTDPNASMYLANTAITRGKPGVTIESGALGMSDEESIARIERGVAGVMKYLKMQTTGPDPVAHPVYLGKSQVLTSPATGIFYWTVERGQTVAEGALIGYVTDFFGKRLAEIRAPFAGEVLYVVGTPAMNQGEPVGFIGERAAGPGPSK
ncbi:MAG: succinylglutamate desuccinylase/aspartoacylase family protein [Bacteroidales bacterium]